MLKIKLYSRPGCHLCDEVMVNLQNLSASYPFEVDEINIDKDVVLGKKYLLEIPVIKIGTYTLKAPIDQKNLEITIRAAITNEEQSAKIRSTKKTGFLDRFANWFTKNWLMMVNLFFIVYLGLAFLAPILLHLGYDTAANVIYKVYSFFCHQLAFRSFFLFGEQPLYPREAAHISELISFGAATGLNELDLFGARNFLGNDLLGYKVALCERDVAIYTGIILFGLIFGLLKKKVKALPFYAWILFSFLPVAFDGVSQLISQLPLKVVAALIPMRESTPFLRTFTGFLFGLGTAWMGYPVIDESMDE